MNYDVTVTNNSGTKILRVTSSTLSGAWLYAEAAAQESYGPAWHAIDIKEAPSYQQ
jgi:hypothetical protein